MQIVPTVSQHDPRGRKKKKAMKHSGHSGKLQHKCLILQLPHLPWPACFAAIQRSQSTPTSSAIPRPSNNQAGYSSKSSISINIHIASAQHVLESVFTFKAIQWYFMRLVRTPVLQEEPQRQKKNTSESFGPWRPKQNSDKGTTFKSPRHGQVETRIGLKNTGQFPLFRTIKELKDMLRSMAKKRWQEICKACILRGSQIATKALAYHT